MTEPTILELVMVYLLEQGFNVNMVSGSVLSVRPRYFDRPEAKIEFTGKMVRCGHENGVLIDIYDPSSFWKIEMLIMKCLNQKHVGCSNCAFQNHDAIAKPS